MSEKVVRKWTQLVPRPQLLTSHSVSPQNVVLQNKEFLCNYNHCYKLINLLSCQDILFLKKKKSLQVLSKQGKMVWGAISVSLHKICWALFLASSGCSKARTHSGKEPQLYQFLREWSGVFHWEIISLFSYIRWDKIWPEWHTSHSYLRKFPEEVLLTDTLVRRRGTALEKGFVN